MFNNATETEKQFCKALHDSHGKANNETIYKLIKDYGCTAEDVLAVANKTKNENFLDDRLARYSQNEYAVGRLLRKQMNKDKMLTFRDYEWYFKYMPDEYKDYPLSNKLTLGNTRRLDSERGGIYSYQYAMTILNRDKYPSELLTERFKDTELYKVFTVPYSLKDDVFVTFDLKNCGIRQVGARYTKYYSKVIDCNVYDYEAKDEYGNYSYSTYTSLENQKRLVEQMVQIDLLSAVMENEIYTQEELEKDVIKLENNTSKRITHYQDYIFSSYRRTGSRTHNYPQKVRLELFSQTKSLEMLLGMGLGIKVKENYSYKLKYSNKKLLRRIQTAYKTFIKAKTVDDRKNMRALLKDQLTILSNDFMGNNLEIVELNCVAKQDELFESGSTSVVVSRTKVAPVTSGATFVKKSFDLSKLAQASTQTVEKGRH